MTTERIQLRFTVVSANIGRTYRAARAARTAIASVLRRFPHAVIGWQEIDEADPADEHGILSAIGRRLRLAHRQLTSKLHAGWQLIGFHQLCPLSIPRQLLEVKSHEVKPACASRRKVTPARVIVIARCVFRSPAFAGVVVAFMNGHLPFRAPDLWAAALAAWQAAIAEEIDAGRIVVVTMDSNHHGVLPALHPRARVLTVPDAIDRVVVILPRALESAGVEVTSIRRVTSDLNIDGHNADGVVLELSIPVAA